MRIEIDWNTISKSCHIHNYTIVRAAVDSSCCLSFGGKCRRDLLEKINENVFWQKFISVCGVRVTARWPRWRKRMVARLVMHVIIIMFMGPANASRNVSRRK